MSTKLDEQMVKNFRAGLRRHTKTYEQAAREYNDLEQQGLENGSLTQDLLRDQAQMALVSEAAIAIGAAAQIRFFENPPSAYTPTGSPLEIVLMLAIHTYGAHACWKVVQASCRESGHIDPTPRDMVDSGVEVISICAQHLMPPYRADFLVTGYHAGVVTRVVVEVDGHDFHERTKHQASHDKRRDRRMQRDGFIVFRFTGSDVYSDAFACAKEVVDAALGAPA